MRKSAVLWIVGGVIVAGAVVYGIYRYFQDQEDSIGDSWNTPKTKQGGSVTPEIAYDDTSWHKEAVSHFEQTQLDTVTSIRKHHKAAAQQLESTLNEMAEDTSEFKEKITKINDDLDALLQ